MTLTAKTILFIINISFLIVCCQTPTPVSTLATTKEYNLNKPLVTKLPLELDEVSGISFYEKDASLFAICDDKKAIFKINKNLAIAKWKIEFGQDIEDIVRLDSAFYLLQSSGSLIKVTFDNDKPMAEEYKFSIDGSNEFEAMYYDNKRKRITLICKDCEADKKKSLTTYAFNTTSNTYSDSSFVINVTSIDSALGVDRLKFKPSAAAINPINGLLYIVSAVNKLLVITDGSGNFKASYPLNPTVFKQPEGITFKENGDMIISNESHETGTATLLSFKYQSTEK
jgi:uncharacterized protein YjiK